MNSVMCRYQMVVHRSILIGHSKLSPLHWTAISWFIGIVVAAPLLPKLSHHLDHGYHQPFLLGAGTTVGSFICLLTGFFNTTWLFPFYIAIITVAIIAASSVHTRHLALIIRTLASSRTRRRITISSRMSLSVTAVGSFATTFIALFTFHMLRRSDHLTSLWVVSIFCGLKWFLGFTEMFFSNRPGSPSSSLALAPNFWPQLVGRLISVFLSSFSYTCIFTSATLYIVGSLCMKPVLVLSLWMVYFLFAAITLPALHPLQLLIRVDPVKLNLFGFILSAIAAGLGFYFKNSKWHYVSVLFVTVIQSAGAGILHAFGKVMILDRSPQGKEGVFASWYEWVKMSGSCVGFVWAAATPDDIRRTFGVAFLAVLVGIVVLIFGSEVRDFGGSSASTTESGREKSKQGEGNVQV